jgi:hypothetical protein
LKIVDDYLKFCGFFTLHNVKFQPSEADPDFSPRDDSVPSDVDIVGFHPKREGTERIWVISCQKWHEGHGFEPLESIAAIEGNRIVLGEQAWRAFPELVERKWADALIGEIERLTGSAQFTYVTAVARLRGDATVWERHQRFRDNLRGNPIKILTLEEMLSELCKKTNTTAAALEIGSPLEVIQAAGSKP